MSLKKSARLAAKRKLINDLAARKLSGIYEEEGPIYSLGGQFMLNLTNFQDVLRVAEEPTKADE